jgi:hypothetical protein
MIVASVESIIYRIFGDGQAIIEYWNNSVSIARPRNCIAVNGDRLSVVDLLTSALTHVVRAIIIPYSMHTISGFQAIYADKLEYLVFEFGSEFRSITNRPFVRCFSLLCVHFGHPSSLRQLSGEIFSGLFRINAITIPSRVKCVTGGAFSCCNSLRIVQFEFPSQCWRICTSAFGNCPLLDPISLSLSVEFINCEGFNPSRDRFPFMVDGHNFSMRDDCLVRTNGCEVILYLGSSDTFCVGREMIVVGADLFTHNSQFRTSIADDAFAESNFL